MEHLRDKLVPVITCIITAVNYPDSLFFSLAPLNLTWFKKKCMFILPRNLKAKIPLSWVVIHDWQLTDYDCYYTDYTDYDL